MQRDLQSYAVYMRTYAFDHQVNLITLHVWYAEDLSTRRLLFNHSNYAVEFPCFISEATFLTVCVHVKSQTVHDDAIRELVSSRITIALCRYPLPGTDTHSRIHLLILALCQYAIHVSACCCCYCHHCLVFRIC